MSTRTLTQEDPIGLAGGLNLYGFAGGDPINFWDPFGLEIRFQNDEAEEAYDQAKQMATNATNSRDKSIAAAGRALLNVFNELEEMDDVVWIQVEEGLGTSGGFGPRLEPDHAGEWGIQIDPLKDPSMGVQLRLTHELGHAHSNLVKGLPSQSTNGDFLTVGIENFHRTIWGCGKRPSHSRRGPTCP